MLNDALKSSVCEYTQPGSTAALQSDNLLEVVCIKDTGKSQNFRTVFVRAVRLGRPKPESLSRKSLSEIEKWENPESNTVCTLAGIDSKCREN